MKAVAQKKQKSSISEIFSIDSWEKCILVKLIIIVVMIALAVILIDIVAHNIDTGNNANNANTQFVEPPVSSGPTYNPTIVENPEQNWNDPSNAYWGKPASGNRVFIP